MNKTIKLVIFLALFSAASGFALAAVNDMTSPMIEEAKIAAEKENLVLIFNSGEEFKQLDTKTDNPINGVYEATKNGTVVGYVYKATTKGYGGDVVFMVGINADASYKGFVVLEATGETQGIGSKIGEDKFRDQFVSKGLDTSIDTISGATVTSKPVVNALGNIVEHFNDNYK